MQMISSSADILFVFDEEDDENTLKPTYLEDVIVDEIKKLDINSNTMRTEVLVPISSYLKCFFNSDFKQIYMTSSKTGLGMTWRTPCTPVSAWLRKKLVCPK